MFVFFLSVLSLVIASPFASILFYKVLLCNILETSPKNYPVNTSASHHFLSLRHFLRERCLHFEPKNFMLMMHICPKLVRGSMIGLCEIAQCANDVKVSNLQFLSEFVIFLILMTKDRQTWHFNNKSQRGIHLC